MGTLIVGLLLLAIVVIIIRSMIHEKKNGKSHQCDGDCRNCGGHCS